MFKDDRCYTSNLLKSFVEKNEHLFKTFDVDVFIQHFERNVEESTKKVIGEAVQIETHLYTSKWIIFDLRYDLVIGIP